MNFINRLLRPAVSPGVKVILVNGEIIGAVKSHLGQFAAIASSELLGSSPVFFAATREDAAKALCDWAADQLDDFFFVITANPEPDDAASLYWVEVARRGSGELLESFTTGDPYGAVEAAREAQVFTLEERLDRYAEMGL